MFSEIYVYNKPKDIVSGDFYWLGEKEDTIIIAVCDCTGHGVSGAMVSMIGNSLLNKVVHDMHIFNSGKILDQLHIEFLNAFPDQSNGMDCSILCINRDNNSIEFSGAVNPLYILKENNIEIVKGDLFSIGGSGLHRKGRALRKRSFGTKKLKIDPNATYLMTSDGYIDQFGGQHNKKFNKQRFQELCRRISTIHPDQQFLQIESTMTNWMSTSQQGQIDDILVLGFKL